jgi:hypothetical protein
MPNIQMPNIQMPKVQMPRRRPAPKLLSMTGRNESQASASSCSAGATAPITKAEKRKQDNRSSAERSRKRKADYVAELEKQIKMQNKTPATPPAARPCWRGSLHFKVPKKCEPSPMVAYQYIKRVGSSAAEKGAGEVRVQGLPSTLKAAGMRFVPNLSQGEWEVLEFAHEAPSSANGGSAAAAKEPAHQGLLQWMHNCKRILGTEPLTDASGAPRVSLPRAVICALDDDGGAVGAGARTPAATDATATPKIAADNAWLYLIPTAWLQHQARDAHDTSAAMQMRREVSAQVQSSLQALTREQLQHHAHASKTMQKWLRGLMTGSDSNTGGSHPSLPQFRPDCSFIGLVPARSLSLRSPPSGKAWPHGL